MKKTIFTLFAAMQCASALQAQQMPHPCGTPHGRHPWWNEYNRDRAGYQRIAQERGGSVTTYLPTTLHIVCNDDGKGHGSVIDVLNAFCQLNEDYSSADFHFFIEHPIHFIPNSAFNSHDTIVEGGTFALQYAVPNTFNPFFVSDPAGYCGYSVRYANSVTVNYGCIDGHTLAHELGHDMLLEHPFYGWEGGISHDNSIPADYTQPAPTHIYVDYSMHNTYAGPSQVDTVEVENVDRSGINQNCYTAADGFCDTDADYLNYRWFCDANGYSTQTQIDPLGTVFTSNGEWIMSYSSDGCQQGFSPEQVAAARSFVFNQRASYLYNQNPVRDTILNSPTLAFPTNGTTVSAHSRTFVWNAVPGATHYVLEITQAPNSYSAAQLTETVVTTDTTYFSNYYYAPRAPFLPYAWRVKAFNQGNTCAPVSAQGTFLTSTAIASVGTAAPLTDFLVYPNPIAQGQSLQVQWTNQQTTEANIRLVSLTGQTVWAQQYSLEAGNVWMEVPIEQLAAGVYGLEVRTKEGFVVEKIVVE